VSEQDEIAEQFRRSLVQLRRMAGNPSYSDLERASEHKLRRATVSDVLAGKRVRLPPWPFVSEFVAACRELAEENRLDPEELGTMADWKRHWDSAVAEHIGPRFPGRGPLLARSAPDVGPGPEAAPAELPLRHRAPPPPSGTSPGPTLTGGVEPPLTSNFFGREYLLDQVYRALTRENRTRALVLQGLGGIGKTQLAIEYAHRYASEYDLIWWIPCDTIERAIGSLADLERRIRTGKSPQQAGQGRFKAVFDDLRVGRPYQRWLLIFDDANEPDEISGLIPPGDGHILITSRNNRWNTSEDMLEIEVFTRQESVDFMRSRIRWLSEVDAHRLADAVGDLPLILEHAAEARLPADGYIAKLNDDPIALFSSGQPSPYRATVAETWSDMAQKLHSANSDSLDLLYRLAFFGPGPIPLASLDHTMHQHEISLHSLLFDSLRRSNAIGVLGNAGLLRIDNDTKTINIHRVTQRIVRATLTPDDAERCRHDVHLLLAAADPGSPEDSDSWSRYEGLRYHMTPSGIESCPNAHARRLLINFVSYLRAAGDPETAEGLLNRALRHWPPGGSGTPRRDIADDLPVQAAEVEILLSLGKYDDAFALSRRTIDTLQLTPDQWSMEIGILERTAGVELRLTGQFQAALNADEASREQHTFHLGANHQQTFAAMSNCAIDYALIGRYDKSVELAEEAYQKCRTFYYRADRAEHLSVLFCQNLLSRYKRMAGHYREALELAEQVCAGYHSLIERGVLTADHPWILEHTLDHATALRDMRLISVQDLFALEAEVAQVRNKFWAVFGVANPQTLAADVLLGSLRQIIGRPADAAREVAEARQRYQDTLGADHPYTHACTAFLAGMRRRMDAPGESLPDLRKAIAGLTIAVGGDHPYTLAATVALVNALIDVGAPEAALSNGTHTLDTSRRVLGFDHPHTLACAASVTAAHSALGHETEAMRLREDTENRYRRTLGADHPSFKMFAAGELLDLEFTPIPL
jgi:tetratricopeptide (TPR) repeat protein